MWFIQKGMLNFLRIFLATNSLMICNKHIVKILNNSNNDIFKNSTSCRVGQTYRKLNKYELYKLLKIGMLNDLKKNRLYKLINDMY